MLSTLVKDIENMAETAGVEIKVEIISPKETSTEITPATPSDLHKVIDSSERERYDAYSSTAKSIHTALKTHRLINTTHLDYPHGALTTFYNSKLKAKSVLNDILQKAYITSCNLFDVNSPDSIAYTAAKIYAEHLHSTLLRLLDELEIMAKDNNKVTLFNATKPLVIDAEKNLLHEFNKELLDSENYYKMYNYSYFEDLTDIEVHDFRVNTMGLLGVIEELFGATVEYTIVHCEKALREMENDLELRADTFYRRAYDIYNDYARKIVENVDSITKINLVITE